jgi:hypothetical protein
MLIDTMFIGLQRRCIAKLRPSFVHAGQITEPDCTAAAAAVDAARSDLKVVEQSTCIRRN